MKIIQKQRSFHVFIFYVKEDDWDTNEDFWRIVKCKPSDVKEKSEIEDTDFEADFKSAKLSLYRF